MKPDPILSLADAVFGPEPEEHEHHLLGKLWARFSTGRGSELHVRVGWLAGAEFVQILDYVPTTGNYETSVMVERRALDHLLDALAGLYRHSSGSGLR
jgi:hypothetical protein